MDCKVFRARLDRYVDGELSGAESSEAREHSEACASCARAEAGLRHLRGSLKRVVDRHQPPHGLEAEVLRAIRSRRREPPRRAPAESRRDGTPVWRAKVAVPVPFFALLVLSLLAFVGWLAFARGPARVEVSSGRPAPVTSPSPPEASGGLDFSRYYHGERASIQVVRRASLEGSRQ